MEIEVALRSDGIPLSDDATSIQTDAVYAYSDSLYDKEKLTHIRNRRGRVK